MTMEQVLYLVGSVLTLAGAYLTARLGVRANQQKVEAERDIGSGQLALNIANRLDREVEVLRLWRGQVVRWWGRHEDWDAKVVQELDTLDPGARGRIGNPPAIPDDPPLPGEKGGTV
jgi:hypothetical protein